MHIEAHDIEGTGGIGPVGWSDDPFIAKSKNLAANTEVSSTFRRTADPNIGLADVPAVLIWHRIGNVLIEEDAGILRLAEESEPSRRLNCHVKPETAQQIRIIRLCVPYAVLAFDARAEFAAELKPARQSVIQVLNREQPGSGFVTVECVFGCGLLTPGRLSKSAAEAKERNERKCAGSCHVLLRDLNAR